MNLVTIVEGLINQIEMDDYESQGGYLRNNIHFHAIKAAIEAAKIAPSADVDAVLGRYDEQFVVNTDEVAYIDCADDIRDFIRTELEAMEARHRDELERIRLKVLCFDCELGNHATKQCYSVGWDKCKGKLYKPARKE